MCGISKLLELFIRRRTLCFLFDFSFTYIYTYSHSLVLSTIRFCLDLLIAVCILVYMTYGGMFNVCYIVAKALNHSFFFSGGIHADGKTQTDNSYRARFQLNPPKTKQLFIQQTRVHMHTHTRTHINSTNGVVFQYEYTSHIHT